MKVSINNNNKFNKKALSFKGGPLDGALTSILTVLDTNPMVNALAIDTIAMSIPRTVVDTKERNKFAGLETAFREFTGTFIVCISSGLFAVGLSGLANKLISPEVKVKNTWATNNALGVFSRAWKKEGSSEGFVKNVLSGVSGQDGRTVREWSKIDWNSVQWFDKKSWDKIKWKDPSFKNIQNKMTDGDGIVKVLSGLINNGSVDKSDTKNILKIAETRIGNALKVSKDVQVQVDDKKLGTSLSNLLRDVTDTGKNLFNNKNINLEAGLKKLNKVNNIKTYGALGLAAILAIVNQYINRKITQKRTGSDNFVGNVDYTENLENKKHEKKKDKSLLLEKTAAAVVFALMLTKTLNVKNLGDFAKRLEVTGPVTGGNAIKAVFGSLVLGRLFASRDKTELRETVVRDYLAFLNWLVLGGFVTKGVGNLLDKGQKNLFNISRDGKGVKHWLNNVSLKSHAEIAAQGGKDVAKNLRKLNIAHLSGLAYSMVVLGVVLPKFNIWMSKKLHKNKPAPQQTQFNISKQPLPPIFKGFETTKGKL